MNRMLIFATALFSVSLFVTERSAFAQEVMVGEVRLFGFEFCPEGWAAANGQLLSVMENQSLFSLLGTKYGGDGRTTFALPDLRGRAPIHQSYDHRPGERGGVESVTLTHAHLPSHQHQQGITLTTPDSGINLVTTEQSGDNTISVSFESTGSAGAGLPYTYRSPYIVMNYCVALVGRYPSRN